MQKIEDTTSLISEAVSEIDDPVWQFELAALTEASGLEPSRPAGFVRNAVAQIAAFKIATLTLGWLILRHGGTSPRKARNLLADSATIVALNGEDTTRTRPLRSALAALDNAASDGHYPILLLGRPSSSVKGAFAALDPRGEIGDHKAMRPLSPGSFLRAIPEVIGLMFASVGQTARYRRHIPFSTRIAIAYRMAQGASFARWWERASEKSAVTKALFGHTGNADTSQLEQSMQAQGIKTLHAVHGTNIGWPLTGLSDVAVFPSGADAALGRTLPAYGKCGHVPLERPAVSRGNNKWALLTSYTHLQHAAYRMDGASADIALVRLVANAASEKGQDPAAIFWRPHPQINLVDAREKSRLEQEIEGAGFSRWPQELPYDSLGKFSAVITTPSTVLTDALRLGQPAIVARTAPMQKDLLYARHPLLVQNSDELGSALEKVLDPAGRIAAFNDAWQSIEPGAAYTIEGLLGALAD